MNGLLGVETDNTADIEFGCTVWSRTHQNSSGFVGGCVVELDEDAAKVVTHFSPAKGPQTATVGLGDVDMQLTTFDTRNAGVVAQNLFSWLGRMPAKTRAKHHSHWGEIAVRLSMLADGGMYTPKAERRYQRNKAAS
jgi:hypothetical protein